MIKKMPRNPNPNHNEIVEDSRSISDIAKEYNLSESQVYAIKRHGKIMISLDRLKNEQNQSGSSNINNKNLVAIKENMKNFQDSNNKLKEELIKIILALSSGHQLYKKIGFNNIMEAKSRALIIIGKL